MSISALKLQTDPGGDGSFNEWEEGVFGAERYNKVELLFCLPRSFAAKSSTKNSQDGSTSAQGRMCGGPSPVSDCKASVLNYIFQNATLCIHGPRSEASFLSLP